MFGKSSPKTFKLEFEGSERSFSSPQAFDDALLARTAVPPPRVAALTAMERAELHEEMERLARAERFFGQLLWDASREAGRIEAFFGALEPALIDPENDWRGLMSRLAGVGPEFEPYRRVALAKYVQYLATARELLFSIQRQRASQTGSPGSRGAEARARQALRIDLPQLGAPRERDLVWARLAKGERVALRLAPHQCVTLRLARHAFLLVAGDPFLLIDDRGCDHRLAPGTNLIGRGDSVDVVVDAGYRAISRRHLIIEPGENGEVLLTDLSSMGTFLSTADLPADARALAGALH